MGFLSSLSRSLAERAAQTTPQGQFSDGYTVLDKLGQGTFAKVYACCSKSATDLPSGWESATDPVHGKDYYFNRRTEVRQWEHPGPNSCAVKVFDKKRANLSGVELEKDFRAEVKIWRLVGSDAHCVQLFHAFEERRFCYIVMEQCSCTVQEAFVNSCVLEEHHLTNVFRCTLNAIQHLHARGIIHRDVKPSNLLLANGTNLSENPAIKLGDFGLAKQLPRATMNRLTSKWESPGLREKCGTVPYMSPEMLLKSSYGSGVDIWACGVTAYLMLFGNYPYRATSGCSTELAVWSQVTKAVICAGRVEPSYKANHGFPQPSPAACQFVAWLLTRNPEQRPDASDALCSAFLKSSALPPSDARSSERKKSFHDTLLLAHDVVKQGKDSSAEEETTDCGSDGDHCSTDGEYIITSL
jgi:serine/threonine protein kinase